MSPAQLVVLALVFAAIVLFGQAAYYFIKARQDEETGKIRHRLGMPDEDVDDAIASLLREQAADGALDALGNYGETLQDAIQQSGQEMTVSALVMRCVMAGLVVGLGLTVAAGAQSAPFALIAAYVPIWLVHRAAAKRSKDMLSQMPDSFEMMGRAMQTGAGLTDCFRLVQAEMADPISSEFGRVADEVHFGKDWRTALTELINRNPSIFELRLFVSSVLLQRETGGNMIETFNRISKLIRQRYAFDNKVKAMTSEARTSGLVLAGMPVAVLIMVGMANAPYLLPLIETPAGQVCLVYALASYGMGLWMMTNMSTVEV